MSNEEEESLKSSEEALENHVLTIRKEIVDDTLVELLEMKINLLREFDRNTVKMTSNILEASSTDKDFEILQKTIQNRVETHRVQFDSVHRILESLTTSVINASALLGDLIIPDNDETQEEEADA